MTVALCMYAKEPQCQLMNRHHRPVNQKGNTCFYVIILLMVFLKNDDFSFEVDQHRGLFVLCYSKLQVTLTVSNEIDFHFLPQNWKGSIGDLGTLNFLY